MLKILQINFIFCFLTFAQNFEKYTEDIIFSLNSINAAEIKANTLFLSADLLEGRGMGSRGELLASEYIQARFQAMGLKPAFPGNSFVQIFPVTGVKSQIKKDLNFSKKDKSITFKNIIDYVASSYRNEKEITLNHDLIFMGYGIEAPEYGWNDYKDIDVNGKVLLLLNDEPKSHDPEFFSGKARTYYGRWNYKFELAAKKGAIAVIIIHTDTSAGYNWDVVVNSWASENFHSNFQNKLLAQIWLKESATENLLNLLNLSLSDLKKVADQQNFKPVDMNLKVGLYLENISREITARNVAAILEGSDSTLKNQYLVHSAHYDHLGISFPVGLDSIYNGASDNAVGVSLMISIAKAFTLLKYKPKRSIIFLACTAEESGSLGSQYFVENPPVPIQNIIANFNTDGVNIIAPTEDITFLGLEKNTLRETISEVVNRIGIRILPDEYPETGGYYRSDQFSFAKVGIPALGVRGGKSYKYNVENFEDLKNELRRNYHQPTDTVSTWWDFSAVVQQAQIVFLCELEVANQNAIPIWYPLQEFKR